MGENNCFKTKSLLELSLLLLLIASCIKDNCCLVSQQDVSDDSIIETIKFKDAAGVEHEEFAFREPARGRPEHVLDMFCASVKLRLYWSGYRDEVKAGLRKGVFLRRMARLARHIFKDVRDADKPFNATMLSRVDEYFAVKLDAEDELLDRAIAEKANKEESSESVESMPANQGSGSRDKLRSFRHKISKKFADGKSMLLTGRHSEGSVKELIEDVEGSETMRELEKQGDTDASTKIKQFVKSWGPKVALAIYTRFFTMWWMMMSCLFAKFYLWDPALDEFMKLKRSLVMWPELQMAKMQDLKCKPLMFFKRLMDICKVMNPLMRVDFGQFNLDKLTRFKSDS